MRTVILRDDDTNALTPVECLEKLYRPFLARGLPVNLATIPEVRVDARTPEGSREGFLPHLEQGTGDREQVSGDRGQATGDRRQGTGGRGKQLSPDSTVPLAENQRLVRYLHENPGYAIVQHGCYHDTFEFDRTDRAEIVRRLERGRQQLQEAGFGHVHAFVAPHDRISRVAYEEIARRFEVISTGWFELRRLPLSWRPRYLLKKLSGRPHWHIGRTLLLSHPGCLLSYQRQFDTMLDTIKRAIAKDDVTVLVTHWWEYFRNGTPDEAFIRVLHRTADYLASRPDVRVTTFEALAKTPAATKKNAGSAMAGSMAAAM